MGQQYASSPQGSREIAMTEGELERFFGVTWRVLNYRLQAIQKYSNLHPEEMCASKRERGCRLCATLSSLGNHSPVLSVGQHGSPLV
jgi:conserved domain protein